jgi:hypothetical protein
MQCPLFFAERRVIGIAYYCMLTLLLLTSSVQDKNNFILQHDWTPYHWGFCVILLKVHHLTGRATDGDLNFLLWPPRSPHFTPLDTVCGGNKNIVYVLTLPRYPKYYEISISNIFAQICRETLPYCEQRWDTELRYAKVIQDACREGLRVRT